MAEYEFQCKNCGHQMDGVLHCPPDLCPECGCTGFEDAEAAEEREALNRATNAHAEQLEEEGFYHDF